MTKKDYELIADSLNILVKCMREYDKKIGRTELTLEEVNFMINQVVFSFASKLKEDNNRFDTDKFLQAVNK